MSDLATMSKPSPSSPGAAIPRGAIQLKLGDALKQAQTAYAQGDLDKSERFAAAILAKHPRHTLAMQVMAGVAEKRGQSERALEILNRSLTGTSGDALALMNLCRILRLCGRLDESRAAGERAVALGTLAEAFVDLADTHTALGNSELAQELLEKAVARQPTLPRARLGLAHALLRKGDFRSGFVEYEWRYRLPATENLLPKFKQAQWNGMALKSSRLLIVADQGYGDSIQFARYLPMVRERANNVVMGCGPELRSLIESIKGAPQCYERWEHLPPFDFQITLSSLPLALGTTVETIPASTPYVSADPAKVAAWRARLTERAGGRKTVGFVWQGRPTHPGDRWRSLALAKLAPLLELDAILPVSLQVGDGREQLATHPARARVLDAGDELKTFADTAAIVSALDCVVSIDSAVAHLTGALARPGLVMLTHPSEWRWFDKRSDSPWYKSLELVRQGEDRSWDGVVARITDRLAHPSNPNTGTRS